MAIPVVAVGLVVGGFRYPSWPGVAGRAGEYVAWAGVQQYWLQAFALRRLRQAGLPGWLAVVAAAGLFAGVHAPNWVLVGLTFSSGIVWCVLFSRRANLAPLALAHAALAMLVFHAWPKAWHLNLRIGGAAIEAIARASSRCD
jgi:hypothetical protein